MSHSDRLAILLSVCAFGTALLFGSLVFENIPHVEDEYAYIWQAQAINGGSAILPSPPLSHAFYIPFVIDAHGLRFGKYPLGYPVILGMGLKLGARSIVNPLLAGFSLWLMYLLIKKVLDAKTALLASLLTLLSPFFLINSSNLLSHAWSLFLSAGFVLAWLDVVNENARWKWLTSLVSAACLGVLALTRPLTAVAVGLPFAVHAVLLLKNANRSLRIRLYLVAALTALIASIHFLWQWALTGDPLINPYTLWWSKDAIGFGAQVGYQPNGYMLNDALINLVKSLRSGASDLFGWRWFSWLFIPFGILAIRKKPQAWLVSTIVLSLVLVYTLYWAPSSLFGPRYYYEGLFSLTMLSAAGIAWLAGRLPPRWSLPIRWRDKHHKISPVWLVVGILVLSNLGVYLPGRAASLQGLYGVTTSSLAPFRTAQITAATPCLVLVRGNNWNAYYALLELGSPYLNGPFVIAYSPDDLLGADLIAAFPNRTVLYIDSDHPSSLTASPP